MLRFKKKTIFYCIFLAHIVGLLIYYNSDSLRKLTYGLTIGAGFFYVVGIVLNKKLVLKKDHHYDLWKRYFQFYFILFYLVILQSFLAFFKLSTLHSRFFSEAIFLIFPLLSIIVITYFLNPNDYNKYVKVLYWGAVVAFFLEKGNNIFSLSSFNIVESLIYSRFSAESGLAFLLGLFAFYFLFKKQWLLFLSSLFFVFISGKRTVILAFLLCIIIYYSIKLLKINTGKYRVLFAILAVGVNAAIMYFIYMLVSGSFDNFIIANTGLPPNSFTKGRYNLWVIIIDKYPFSFVGSGLGSISKYLVNDLDYPLHNPLNDVLKVCIEHGVIVFVVWFFLFYYTNARTKEGLLLIIYSNILFLTTNVLIYFFYMFTFYFIQIALLPVRKHRNPQIEAT